MGKSPSRPAKHITRLRSGVAPRMVAGPSSTSDPSHEDELTSFKHRLRRKRAKQTARKKADKAKARRKKGRR